MDLNHVKPTLHGTLHGGEICSLEFLNLLQRHLLRLSVVLVPRDRTGGQHIVRPAIEVLARNRTARQPRRHSRSLASSMPKLYHDLLSLAVRKLNDFAEVLHLTVLPQSNILRSDSSLRRDTCGLDTGESSTALNDAAHVRDVPHGIVTVLGGVLTERREHDAIMQRQASELERLEQLSHALLAIGDEGGASGRILCWREVGDAWSSLVDIVRFFLHVGIDIVVRGNLRHPGGFYLYIYLEYEEALQTT